MKVFEAYAAYYDLLYKDKNYQEESEYINLLIEKYNPKTETILNLGCGTGSHDFLLADKGYTITGVDLSQEMVDEANTRRGNRYQNNITFLQGDLKKISLNNEFDTVISLFHVVSYLNSNNDLKEAFANVKKHLKPNGLFIFDCWYGPAVLSDKPTLRTKYLANDQIEITRIADPFMHQNDNLVDVNYHLFIKDKKDNSYLEIREQHKMRYLFKPELECLFSEVGLKIIHSEEWLTRKVPGFGTWGVCFIVTA